MKIEKKSGLTFWLAGGLVAILCFGLALIFNLRHLTSAPDRCGVTTQSGQVGQVSGSAKHKTPKVTDATFQSLVLESKTPVMVDFWAPWCGPCRKMSPVVDSFYAENQDKLKVYKLNCDKNPVTARKCGIRGIPSILLFKDGKLVAQVVGAVPKTRLVEVFGKHLEGQASQQTTEQTTEQSSEQTPPPNPERTQ